jgi:hypothetical protein
MMGGAPYQHGSSEKTQGNAGSSVLVAIQKRTAGAFRTTIAMIAMRAILGGSIDDACPRRLCIPVF